MTRIIINYFSALFAPLREKIITTETQRTQNFTEKLSVLLRALCVSVLMYFIFPFSYSFAQQNKIDSLNSLLQTATHDTTRASILMALTEEFFDSHPDTVIPLCKKAIAIIEKNIVKANRLEKHSFLLTKADALNNFGFIYNVQGQVKEALDYYGRSLKLEEEFGNKLGIATSLNNIGMIYSNQGQVKEALDYQGRSLKLREEIGDKQGIATSLNNIGFIYNNQDQVKEALDYQGRSLKLKEEIGDKQGIATSLNNIGFIYNNQGQVKEALDYYSRSLKLYEEIGDKRGIAYSLNNIGGIYLQQKNYLLALSYTDSSLSLAKELGYPENIRNAELTLAKIDSARGKPAGAFEHYKLYIVYRDSIKNKENEKAAIRQQTKYEFEKVLLVKEQEEKEKSRQVAVAVGRRNKLQYSIILIVVVTLLSSLLLLGKIKVSHKIAEGLIFFVFLIFFEFILVLADPYIESVTGGAPGYKLLFNAIIAALIFPVHGFFERLLKKRLK